MSEQQLKEFGARAESVVDIPDFAELDRQGRSLRLRRRASIAAAVAVVLTVGGIAAAQIHKKTVDTGPIKPPQVHTYRGATMKDLEPGTYRLHPSRIERDLTADLTVPDGWNAWIGPNRFDGHAPGRTNDEAVGHLTWYVGALVLEVDAVNTRGCGAPTNDLDTTKDVVRALGRAFSTEVVRGPEPGRRFGHPATRMRLRVTRQVELCRTDTTVLHSTADGYVDYAGPGTLLDVWVVDVDGTPIYVQRAWTPNAPDSARGELDGVIDSLEFGTRE